MGLSKEGKLGSLLKIVILKRVIDVVLVNEAEGQRCLALPPSQKSKGFSGRRRALMYML